MLNVVVLINVTNICRFFVPNIIILKEASTIELFYLQARTLIFKVSAVKNAFHIIGIKWTQAFQLSLVSLDCNANQPEMIM